MNEQSLIQQWLARCADRLQQRYHLSAAAAREMAAEVLQNVGLQTCPERVADASWRRLEAA